MAINIPLPGLPTDALQSGVNTGMNWYTRMMQPRLAREQLAQQMKIHQDSMALQRAAAARAAALQPLRQQILQEQLKSAQEKNNPLQSFQNMEQIKSFLQSRAPKAQQLTGEGMGAFSPEGQESFNQEQKQNALDFNDPLLRGAYKKAFGIDPAKTGVLTGAAREANDLETLKNSLPGGEENPIYQQAKSAYEAKQQARTDLSNVRERTLTGLKPGETWAYNDKNERIGKNIPLTATERKEESGRGFFNHTFDYITRGLAPISGQGSIRNLTNAAINYGKDPKDTQIIDDFLLGKMLLTATTVNESATLGSGKQQMIFNNLKSSLDASDIPDKLYNTIRYFGVPASAMIKAQKRFKQVVNDATDAGRRAVPANRTVLFNPESGAPKAENSATTSTNYKPTDMVVVETPDGERTMTYAEAIKLGAK